MIRKLSEIKITETDQYLFGQGTNYEIYKKMGAHIVTDGEKTGVYFSLWAPKAVAVSVVGDFNGWDIDANYMDKIGDIGIWDIFIPDVKEGDLYKFCIKTLMGTLLYKADPYGNYSEERPGTASKVTDLSDIKWTDKEYMEKVKNLDHSTSPISVYEVHIGSWRTKNGYYSDKVLKEEFGIDKEELSSIGDFYNYRRFAVEICEYVKEMGYTHIELMGIAEYPFDGSWGYQVTGYYAPTSRYGNPKDFAWMINYLHENNIGVILDWVPAHFPRDSHGLADFDGTPTYEYADPKKGEHPDWGTKIFDYGKNEVRNFLIANAIFWIKDFHIDGLRVDAVASMLYLDYGKEDGQWIANEYGGNENLEAIELFKHLNSIIRKNEPQAIMIAEESTAWPKVTDSPDDGGLGFHFKWNMGWMHDFTEYMKLDPLFRKGAHYMMTFAMSYANSEHYILVLSHDEVVHLKRSMLMKMPGDVDERFANLKVAYAFMMGHVGKKLLFMGQDFGEDREWSEERELDWASIEDDNFKNMKSWSSELLKLYRDNPAMYQCDKGFEGFEWLDADDKDNSVYTFIRFDKKKQKHLLFVMNFTPLPRKDYKIGVHEKGEYKLLLSSEEKRFGGTGEGIEKSFQSKNEPYYGREYSIKLDIPSYGALIYEYDVIKEDK
ncbi:MAG: 1,4-alpha-glucan branching protein GlgB [Lachnospiraceae bacterium]|jgi:1,4-alpha-glucan branching enzyme|nr:1,4-alpha-glucan branching protein GlgB [Lachnospiraceae bacterium]